ncbi:MAG TPA: hypothetical protein VLT36_16945 [Candidatus Dormibacteraeota bacterium]|nr:hypothetical protein [Candidatus Dormibacteraeota bacterium]
MSPITQPLLDSYLGKHIDKICPSHYKANNHCAHFVSHVLDLSFGYQCGSRANVRVHEVFAKCPSVEELLECRGAYGTGLLFVTGEKNVHLAQQSMENVPKKHIGIVYGAFVWHYSNTKHQVVKEIVDQFIFHYKHQQNGLWLGGIPVGAEAHEF